MLPHRAYQKQQNTGPTRIDTILGLYDEALARIGQAADFLARGDEPAARAVLNKAQFAISGLVCGVQGHADSVSLNMLRLYEFVTYQLTRATPEAVAAAKRVLENLRGGFETIRAEAVRLERAGLVPPLDRSPSVQATA